MARILEQLGHRVLQATDGEQALQLAQERLDELDVVISDVVMPGLEGPELIRALYGRKPTLRLALMSGYGLDDWLVSRQSDLPIVWLNKPISVQSLADLVEQASRDDR